MIAWPMVGAGAAIVAGLLVLLWFVSLAARDSSLIDLFWGLGFVVLAWVGVWLGPGDGARKILGATLVTLWGVRLSVYLAWRNLGHGEDKRYQAMRAKAGPSWWWISLFQVFLLQGVLMLLVSAPVQVSASAEAPLWAGSFLGVVLVFFGVGFETIGDLQLVRFKGNPANKGKVMDQGLWRYTRHPNYFGDAVVWWGLWLFAASAGLGAAAWSLPGPVVMTWLLTRVSGVPMLERGMRDRPGYSEYLRRTSGFFPRPPKP